MSEKGFSGFWKTAPMLFYPKPRDSPPLVFIPRSPQVVLGPLYLDGGGGVPGRPVLGEGFPVPASRLHHIQKDTHHPLEEGACGDAQNAWCRRWWAQVSAPGSGPCAAFWVG